MAEIVDHISDDGLTSLCGLAEDEMPNAPLCPVCVAVEKRLPPQHMTARMHGTGFVHRAEQPAAP